MQLLPLRPGTLATDHLIGLQAALQWGGGQLTDHDGEYQGRPHVSRPSSHLIVYSLSYTTHNVQLIFEHLILKKETCFDVSIMLDRLSYRWTRYEIVSNFTIIFFLLIS